MNCRLGFHILGNIRAGQFEGGSHIANKEGRVVK